MSRTDTTDKNEIRRKAIERQLLQHRPCKYLSTLEATPNRLLVSDYRSTRAVPFAANTVDKLFSADAGFADDTLAIIPPLAASQNLAYRCLMPTKEYGVMSDYAGTPMSSEVGETLISLGLTACRHNVICLNTYRDSYSWQSEDAFEEMRREDIVKLHQAGIATISLYDAINTYNKTALVISREALSSNQANRKNTAYYSTIQLSDSLYEQYLNALKTLTISNLDFVWTLCHEGSAISNSITQAERQIESGTADIAQAEDYWNKLLATAHSVFCLPVSELDDAIILNIDPFLRFRPNLFAHMAVSASFVNPYADWNEKPIWSSFKQARDDARLNDAHNLCETDSRYKLVRTLDDWYRAMKLSGQIRQAIMRDGKLPIKRRMNMEECFKNLKTYIIANGFMKEYEDTFRELATA